MRASLGMCRDGRHPAPPGGIRVFQICSGMLQFKGLSPGAKTPSDLCSRPIQRRLVDRRPTWRCAKGFALTGTLTTVRLESRTIWSRWTIRGRMILPTFCEVSESDVTSTRFSWIGNRLLFRM